MTAAMNAGQVVAVVMDTRRAAVAAMNAGQAAVVKRVAAAIMRGRRAASEKER